MLTAGIDAGSRAVKIVLYDADRHLAIDRLLADQGARQAETGATLLAKLLDRNDLRRDDIHRIVATGYARNLQAMGDETVTEITCHAVGVRALLPEVRTIIEIGGQDSKLIRLDERGRVRDFAMNDRCAAGTGRFLEIVADRLALSLTQLGEVAARSREPAAISSMCVVFAETEIIGLLADGRDPADIVAGVQHAICSRIAAMAGPQLHPPAVFTGGVALLPGMRDVLAEVLGVELQCPPDPQFTGALGAAILATGG
jgi:predicted CoA-substrate-specific enzyme activase